ncbi:MAG: hypothetical protein DHS20C07_05280 [Methyloligella sp.]|nr:MAG: hypothetical protein DHS20C07_05280 [Methyloligella sp.]
MITSLNNWEGNYLLSTEFKKSMYISIYKTAQEHCLPIIVLTDLGLSGPEKWSLIKKLTPKEMG